MIQILDTGLMIEESEENTLWIKKSSILKIINYRMEVRFCTGMGDFVWFKTSLTNESMINLRSAGYIVYDERN